MAGSLSATTSQGQGVSARRGPKEAGRTSNTGQFRRSISGSAAGFACATEFSGAGAGPGSATS
jgi:hypothetical protein